MLFDLATARLIEAKVLLPAPPCSPGSSLRPATKPPSALHAMLADALTPAQRERLRALLEDAPGEPVSGLERLRAGPRKLTATEPLELLRLRNVRNVGVGQITVDVPPGRERALARYGLVAKAQALRRMNAKRRDATLLGRCGSSSSTPQTTRSCCFDQVVDQLLSQAARKHKNERFDALPELDHAARRLRAAVLVLLNPPPGGLDALWAAIGALVSRDELHAASEAIGRLTMVRCYRKAESAPRWTPDDEVRRRLRRREYAPRNVETSSTSCSPRQGHRCAARLARP